MKIIEKDIIKFSVDYIEVYWAFKNVKALIKGLDTDNSNMAVFNEFTVMYDEVKNYSYKLTFILNDIPCFAYYEWNMINEYIETKDYFVVYGKAFQIFSLAEIIDFINENLFINKVRRFDLALDVNKSIQEIFTDFRILKQKGSMFFDEKWGIQTYYIWEKKNRLNKSLLIRIYDKIADIKQKELQSLYSDYLLYDNVTRLELEFRSELSCNLVLNGLLDRSYIFWLFLAYISKHTEIFSEFDNTTVAKLIRPKKDVDVSRLSYDKVLKQRYLNTFLWYARKIMQHWSCPVDILLRLWIYSNDTIRDIFLSVENGKFNIEKYKHWLNIRNTKEIFNWDI